MRLFMRVIVAMQISAVAFAESPDQADSAFYTPVVCEMMGWQVKVDPALLNEENQQVYARAKEALENHLQRVTYIVPEPRLGELRKLPIWLELHNSRLANMQYHPSVGWLQNEGHDPALAKHVHIPRAEQLYDRGMWAKHPYVVLHELAHSFHDQVLGFDHHAVENTYNDAKQSGKYDQVLLFNGKTVPHYGLTNHKEYFAEATEAYFGVNDFYPFTRAELREHDPNAYRLLESIWGKID